MQKGQRDDIWGAVAGALEILEKSVTPVFRDVDGDPSLLGCAFFIRSGTANLLVSAAHVLEHLRSTKLYYFVGPNKARQITGRLTVNVHPGGDRDIGHGKPRDG